MDNSRIHFVNVTLPNKQELQVPFIPQSEKTIVSEGGETVVSPVYPPYVTQLGNGDYSKATRSIAIETALALRATLAFEVKTVEAPIAVCANLKMDEFSFDYDSNGRISRIVVNEAWGNSRAIDSDGDRGAIVLNKDGKYGTLIKFPITSTPPILKRVGFAAERFYDLKQTDYLRDNPETGDFVEVKGLEAWWNQYPEFLYCSHANGLNHGPNNKQFKLNPENVPVWQAKLDSGISIDELLAEGDDSVLEDGSENEGAISVVLSLKGKIHTATNEEKTARKTLAPSNVGLLTSAWNTKELEATLRYNRRVIKVASMFRDGGRYIDIEKGGLKATRKDNFTQKRGILDTYSKTLNVKFKLMLTSKKGVQNITLKDALEILDADPKSIYRKVMNFQFSENDFRIPKPSNQVETKEETWIADNNLIYRLCGFEYNGSKLNKPAHLQANRRIRVKQFKHRLLPMGNDPFDLDYFPVIQITLTRPDGVPCALEDVKRIEEGGPESMSYSYILYPVWDGEENRFMHPIEAMNKYFTTKVYVHDNSQASVFDSRIGKRNSGPGEYTVFASYRDYRGEPRDDFNQYGIKALMLQKEITKYCDQHGTLVLSKRVGNDVIIADHNMDIARNMITVSMPENCKEDEFMMALRQADAAIFLASGKKMRLCISGNKQTRMGARKYPLAHTNGVAIYSDPNAHISRPGKQSSQLIRASGKFVMRTAVLVMDSSSQVYITNSGIEKQSKVNAFLPQTFPTLDKLMAHCRDVVRVQLGEQRRKLEEEFGLGTEEFKRAYTDLINEAALMYAETNHKVNTYSKWANDETNIAYMTTPKAAISVGKILDYNGMKFMPREIGDAYDEDGNKIDLLIPIEECIAKGAHRAMMGVNVPTTQEITIRDNNGDVHICQAVVFDHEYVRSGSPSENIPAQEKIRKVNGNDGHQIGHAVNMMRNGYTDSSTPLNEIQDFDWSVGYVKPNFEDVKILRDFGIKISRMIE